MRQPFGRGNVARVIVATGEVFEERRLTPEIEATILGVIDGQPGGAKTGQIAKALGLNIVATSPFLEELTDRGLILSHHSMGRAVWMRRKIDYDEFAVDEDHVPVIRTFLLGRREMAGAIARGTGLPLDEVKATCEWMLEQGMLTGRPVGAAMVYGLDDRVSVGKTDVVPMSPDAVFAAHLATIRSDDRVRIPRRWEEREEERQRRREERERQKAERERQRAEQKATRTAEQEEARLERARRRAEARASRGREAGVERTFRQKPRTKRVTPEHRQLAAGWVARSFPNSRGHQVASHAELRLGLTTSNITHWLDWNPAQRKLCRKEGRELEVPDAVLAEYLATVTPLGATFSSEVPEGWPDIASIKEGLPFGEMRLHKALREGKLSAVYAGGRLRFEPSGLAAFIEAVEARERVPEGWVSLPALNAELGTSRAGAVAWMKRGGHEMRRYPGDRRAPTLYVSAESAQAYRDWHQDWTARRAGLLPLEEAAQPAPDGYLNVADSARKLGIKGPALYKWLERHDEARALCIRHGKDLLLPQQVLTLYVERSLPVGATFSTVVPEGWLDIWGAVDFLGWSHCKVYKMLGEGKLTAVIAGGKLHFDPEPLRALKAELDAETRVPDGWTQVNDLADELGLDRSSVSSWMRRNGHEMHKYRDAQRQLVLYVTDVAAHAYRVFRARTPGGLKITPHVEAEIRKALPPVEGRRPPGLVGEVAARHGITVNALHLVLRRPASPDLPVPDEGAPLPFPAPDFLEVPVPPPLPAPKVITSEIARALRAALPPERRRIPGETARVAAKYGLSVRQVCRELSYIIKEPS